MANVPCTITVLESLYGHTHRIAWSLANLDVGVGVGGGLLEMPGAAQRSVQVTGPFGAAGSVTIEGSNDGGTTWDTLHDSLGAALTFTAVGLKTILEVTGAVRARVTAGDGTTAIKVNMLAQRPL